MYDCFINRSSATKRIKIMNNLPLRKELHEENRLSWNEATKAHNSHKGEQAKFFREGGSRLFPEEIELLGNISGLSLVHLQCNAGRDTLSMELWQGKGRLWYSQNLM